MVNKELEEKRAKYIFKNGKQYKPALCPSNIIRGKVGDCFDVCLLNAVKFGYGYVEGLAMNPNNKEEWILHAWLTDGDNAFDPTWKAIDNEGVEKPIPTVYFGLPMDTFRVFDFVKETEYKSVIENFDKNIFLGELAISKDFPKNDAL